MEGCRGGSLSSLTGAFFFLAESTTVIRISITSIVIAAVAILRPAFGFPTIIQTCLVQKLSADVLLGEVNESMNPSNSFLT